MSMQQWAMRLAGRSPLQSLAPRNVWDAALDEAIAAEAASWAETPTQGSKADRLAVVAGLYLWNDSLDASHDVSQDVHTATGSFWHGIMHRMEGDYGNAKYWFARTGSHPVFGELYAAAKRLLESPNGLDTVPAGRGRADLESLLRSGSWDAYRFVDAVERQVSRERDESTVAVLEQIQWYELALLLKYSYNRATGAELALPEHPAS
ncbi:hypothetical protein [Paenibacillus flagellatus]|uniref:Uncharacterized protein n=1 Tax=Paenibacillus flagellatus TaxID=2211139 RepID=A0A2V5K8U2_9BACL|nr:hypothetical protein [Paenibacillus flagellatus]PYI55818.1 hypothetical protein DLM86_08870 [Paenibacillus flagellatus]